MVYTTADWGLDLVNYIAMGYDLQSTYQIPTNDI